MFEFLPLLDYKLFVGMLPAEYDSSLVYNNDRCRVTEEMITNLFCPYGDILQVKILTTNPTKVCAFVKYKRKTQALAAIEALHGQRALEVCSHLQDNKGVTIFRDQLNLLWCGLLTVRSSNKRPS
jgi:RNA recognition motif-containing protein